MRHEEQVRQARRLLDYLDRGTTAMVDGVYRHNVDDYTCPQQFARERQVFFREGPLCLGASGLARKPGDFFTEDFSGVPILVVRGRDGRLGAFLNVCRHRGARVVDGCGSARGFTCPYHGWGYGLDGRLMGRPADDCFDGMDKAAHGLTPLPIEERDGLIWVCPTPGGTLDVAGHLAGLADDLPGYRLGEHHHYETRVLRRRMNWKLIVDTFLELYHLASLHTNSIYPILHSNLTTFDAFGRNLRIIGPRRSFEVFRRQPEADWDLITHSVIINVLFPNTVLVVQGDHIELWHIYPDGDDADCGVMRLSLYSPEPVTSESAKRHWDNNMDLVIKVVEEEDFPLGEGIQAGFRSGAQDHTTFGRNEPALAHFHRQIKDALGLPDRFNRAA